MGFGWTPEKNCLLSSFTTCLPWLSSYLISVQSKHWDSMSVTFNDTFVALSTAILPDCNLLHPAQDRERSCAPFTPTPVTYLPHIWLLPLTRLTHLSGHEICTGHPFSPFFLHYQEHLLCHCHHTLCSWSLSFVHSGETLLLHSLPPWINWMTVHVGCNDTTR